MQSTKWIILALISLLVTCQAISQPINRKDEQGRRQGKWVKKYPNGTKRYEATFKDNKLIGVYKRYYRNGKVKARLDYQSPGGFASAVFYDRKGNKVSEGYFQGKQKDSTWKYYNERGRKVMQENYDYDQRHGVQKFFHHNGQVAEIKHFKKGTAKGYYKKFYPNGNLFLESYYRKGKLNGWYISYYSNGNKESEGKYKNNLRDSVWTFYTKKGEVSQTITFEEGKAKNQDSLDEAETELINKLEKRRGQIPDPREQFYKNTRFGGQR